MWGSAARHRTIGAVRLTRSASSQYSVVISPTAAVVSRADADRVVHQHGQPTESFDGLGDERLGGVEPGEVGRDEVGFAARGPGLLDHGPPRSASRPWTTTRAPSAANSTATARPMPEVEPVTRASSPAMRPVRVRVVAGDGEGAGVGASCAGR